jgi:ketosteroid isomerase-like protein
LEILVLEKSRLNEWLSIATNLAVLAGLIILVVEIRQNSTAIRSGVLQAVTTESSPLNLALASDSALRETWILGMRNPGGLTESQRLQFNTIMHVWISNAQNWFIQSMSGVLDEEIADGHWTTMATMHSKSPGFKQYWETRSYLYTPTFREFVETEVFTRKPLLVAPDTTSRESVSEFEEQAITRQLDDIYRASLASGEVEERLRIQLRFFVEQPILQPPDQPAIVGHEAVSEFYSGIFASGVQILKNEYSELKIVVDGEIATRKYVGEGIFITSELTTPQSSRSRFFDVLIKENGEWRTLLHSWSPEKFE